LYGKKVIVGCTTNPGDTEQVQQRLNMFNVQVAYNPEFIAQGEIVKGLEQSDIVLIGTEYTELGNDLIDVYLIVLKESRRSLNGIRYANCLRHLNFVSYRIDFRSQRSKGYSYPV
jgi:UDP-glucose 6-dehydrogenase